MYTDFMTSAVGGDDALVTSARRLGWTVLQVPHTIVALVRARVN